MSPWIAYIIGAIAAIACTVLVLVLVTPESKRNSLPKFFVFLHDLCNFKYLVIEKILKALYIAVSIFCIVTGFFLLFSGYSVLGTFRSLALNGLLLLILGPILTRVTFELSMMFVLLVKNTIQINRKLNGKETGGSAADEPTPNYLYCVHCGTRYDANKGGCPNNCGK